MSLRLMNEGLLSEKRLALKNLIVRADALVVSAQMQLSPYSSVQDLPINQIFAQVKDLKGYIAQIQDLEKEVRDLKRDLGVEDAWRK